jgi:hypothetical protein
MNFKTALIGAVFGALAGLAVNILITKWRFWMLYWRLSLIPRKRIGTLGTVRIVNNYIFPIRSAYAYIALRYDYADVVETPSGCRAYIRDDRMNYLNEDRLSWALTAPVENPAALDILSGEQQALLVMNIDSDGQWIEIPSEKGLSSHGNERISRVFLKPKHYTGYIKIVSLDTKAKIFDIQIDPSDREYPVKLL